MEWRLYTRLIVVDMNWLGADGEGGQHVYVQMFQRYSKKPIDISLVTFSLISPAGPPRHTPQRPSFWFKASH